MNDIANDRVGPMQDPPHLGNLIRRAWTMWAGT